MIFYCIDFYVSFLVYIPKETAFTALVGVYSQYGVKSKKVLKKELSTKLKVPKIPHKRVKIPFYFKLMSLYAVFRILSWSLIW